MRFGPLVLLLLLVLPAFMPPATAADPEKPVQVQVRVLHLVFKGELLPNEKGPAASDLREKGWVADDAAESLRPAVAAAVASGRAFTQDTLTIATLDGVGAQLATTAKDQPEFSASLVPHVEDGKIRMDLKLFYGNRSGVAAGGSTFEEKVAVTSGRLLAVRVSGTKQSPGEHLVFLHVTRLDPK